MARGDHYFDRVVAGDRTQLEPSRADFLEQRELLERLQRRTRGNHELLQRDLDYAIASLEFLELTEALLRGEVIDEERFRSLRDRRRELRPPA